VIDPENLTNYNRNLGELEEFVLFGIVAAGKTAKVQSKLLDRFLNGEPVGTPFEKIAKLIAEDRLLHVIKESKLGKWTLNERAMRYLASAPLDLRNATLEELEKIPGVAMKTSRLFVLHNRPNQRVIPLDVHVLKYLRHVLNVDCPKNTPSSRNLYLQLESVLLAHIEEIGWNVAEFDLTLWKHYATGADFSALRLVNA
jgi:hypothetical protein